MLDQDKFDEQRQRLKDWTNVEETGTRFPVAYARGGSIRCPQCAEIVLEDMWPPNYGGFSIGGVKETCHGSMKCICVPCEITFRWWYKGDIRNPETGFSETVPLVEKDGFLLTPNDVWREGYKEEHGEYPVVAYG